MTTALSRKGNFVYSTDDNISIGEGFPDLIDYDFRMN